MDIVAGKRQKELIKSRQGKFETDVTLELVLYRLYGNSARLSNEGKIKPAHCTW